MGRDGAPGVLRRWGDQTEGDPGEVDKVLVQDLVEVVLAQVRLLVTSSSSSFFFFAFCSCCSFFPWPSSFRFSAATKNVSVSILQEQRSNKVAEHERTTLKIEGKLYRLSLGKTWTMFLFTWGLLYFVFSCVYITCGLLSYTESACGREKGDHGGRTPPPKTETNVTIIDLNNASKNPSQIYHFLEK